MTGKLWFSSVMAVCALGGSLVISSNTHAQDNAQAALEAQLLQVQQAQDVAQKKAIAEWIIAREEAASGKAFDPGFRAAVKARSASLSLTALSAQTQLGGLGPLAFGDSQATLVYTPLTPCRLFDTRVTQGGAGPILAGGTRSFKVTGLCGVPSGPATAAVINFVAVNAAGPGDLRVTPFGTPIPGASIINYSAVQNIANAPAIKICDPAVSTCTFDITIQADVSATDVLGDVQGYFSKADLPTAIPMGSSQLPNTVLASGVQVIISPTSVVLPHAGACHVTCEVGVEASVTTGALSFRTARRDGGAGTDSGDPGWFNDAPVPSTSTSASKTHVWDMTGGTTYQFGCQINASGDFVGKFVFPTVAWMCR